MKDAFDNILTRLAAAARRAEPEVPEEAPPFLATRVLATLRERASDRFWWEAMARSVAVTGCALAVVAWLARPSAPVAADESADLASAFLASELKP